MKRLKRDEFKQLLIDNPGKSFAFYESAYPYKFDKLTGKTVKCCNDPYPDDDLHVTAGETAPVDPWWGAYTFAVFDPNDDEHLLEHVGNRFIEYDWNLMESGENEVFWVLDEDEVQEAIDILKNCLTKENK